MHITEEMLRQDLLKVDSHRCDLVWIGNLQVKCNEMRIM